METRVERIPGGIVVVRPRGRLDIVAGPEVRRRLSEAIDAGYRNVVVDLAEVPFMDSTGLAALISGLKAARHAGGDLRIASLNNQVRVILELTRLDRVLRFYPTVEDATASYER